MASPSIPIMFFYLKEEEDGNPNNPDGVLRIVDMTNRKTIAKMKVSQIRETFTRLKRKFCMLVEESNVPTPSVIQSFALSWNDSAARRCQDKGCPSCAEIAAEIQKYVGMKRLSKRLAIVA